jgi:hypothetical protein
MGARQHFSVLAAPTLVSCVLGVAARPAEPQSAPAQFGAAASTAASVAAKYSSPARVRTTK